MGLCDTARASSRIKNTYFIVIALIEVLQRHQVSQFLFCRVAGSCAGSNFSHGQGLQLRQSAKLLLNTSPLNALKKAPVPRGTTGSTETSPGGAGQPPEVKSAGIKQEVLRKQGSSVVPVLAFPPELPAAACLYVPGSRETLLSMLIFMPGQTPFCSQIIRGRGITHCKPV